MSSFIRAQQAVALQVRDRTYLSKVLHVQERERVVVQAPDDKGVPLAPPENTPVRLIMSEPGQPLTFLARVLESGRFGDLPALILSWPEMADRARRRRHLRVDVIVKAEATPQPKPGEQARPLGALTADLSEGGARLTVARPVPIDTVVHLRMRVRPDEVVECAGRVVRCGQTEEVLAPHPYWIAIEFTDLPDATRREIGRLL
jgi:c-di-GMP-binding flagellar brake protein YcgR